MNAMNANLPLLLISMLVASSSFGQDAKAPDLVRLDTDVTHPDGTESSSVQRHWAFGETMRHEV